MKTQSVEVKSGGSTVANVRVEVFETLDEAQEHLGEEKVLSLVNAQHRANVTNEARAKATELTPEQKKAQSLIKRMTPEQLAAFMAATR